MRIWIEETSFETNFDFTGIPKTPLECAKCSASIERHVKRQVHPPGVKPLIYPRFIPWRVPPLARWSAWQTPWASPTEH